MTPTGRDICALAEMVAGTDEVLLLGIRRGRKARIGSATLGALDARAATDPDRVTSLAFAVRARSDLVVLDADTAEQAAAALDIVEEARRGGHTPVVVRSGSDGHLHVFCATGSAEATRHLRRLADAAGIDERSGNWVRPPLSAHPAAGEVSLVAPATIGAAIAALAGRHDVDEPAGSAPVPEMPSRSERRQFGPPLSQAMAAVLRDGDGNPDRSVTLQRVVTAMVNRGWTLEAAWSVLTSPHAKAARKLHERLRVRGEEAAWRYLAQCWSAAEQFCAENPPTAQDPKVHAEIARLVEHADSTPWPGAAGSTTWMVFHQLCAVAVEANTLTPTASERQLAERCALGRVAVHDALRRLRDTGWIRLLHPGSGPNASLWSLCTPPPSDVTAQVTAAASTHTPSEDVVVLHPSRRTDPLTQPRSTSAGGVRDSGLILRAGHDAFRHAALGALGYRVLRYLWRSGAATVSEIAAALGCHPGSVTRMLRTRLGAVGLCERVGWGRWTVSSGLDLAAVLAWAAVKFGTNGAGLRQRRWHAVERAEYRRSVTWGRDLGWWVQWEAERGSPLLLAA